MTVYRGYLPYRPLHGSQDGYCQYSHTYSAAFRVGWSSTQEDCALAMQDENRLFLGLEHTYMWATSDWWD